MSVKNIKRFHYIQMTSKLTRTESKESQLIEEKVVKASGETTIRQYTKGRFLGKGGFARVYEFLNLDNKQISAGKVISKASLVKSRARQKLMSEIKIHRSLSHQHIVKFEHFFEDSENVYILLELCTNQTLSELIRRRKRLSEIEVQCYTFQVISALKYLHSHRVIHRDIKLGNLFLTDKMEIKLGDFGLATKLEFDGERKRTICGTPNYIAPEILDGSSGHSYEVDTWSLGVLIYTMLVGKPPFETNDVKLTYRRIKMNAYSFPDQVNISKEARNIVSEILVSDPKARPSLDDLLTHSFLTKNPLPRLLPASTLAVPPSSNYLKQFEPIKEEVKITRPPRSASQTRISEDLRALKAEDGRLTERENHSATRPTTRTELAGSSSSRKTASMSSYSPVSGGPTLWVTKWVDYSNKYGLGYMLSNGCAGVYFNDSSKIIANSRGDSFQYTCRVQSKEEVTVQHNILAFPQELQKKVTLLQHFRKHLMIEKMSSDESKDLIYIKKWLVTDHAIIFRMSNKVVQVCFLDKSELVLCSESKIVTYVDRSGISSVYPLSTAMETQNREMAKRLRYTKEILTSMLNPGTGGTGDYRPGRTEG
jgi:polo-like kinase 1